MDIRDEIQSRPLSGFQIRTIAICLVLNMIDGYDVLVMPFTAPAVARHWHLDEVFLGYLLSASLLGMTIGSFLLAPLADRIGRRNLTNIALAFTAVGMAASVFAPSATVLLLTRIFAGIGIGGMVPNITVLVNEYSNTARRALTVGIFATGYPIGATVGGLVAKQLIAAYGWRSAFLLGAVITVVMLVVCALGLPDSYEHLMATRHPRSLERLNSILRRMGLSEQAELPALREGHRSGDTRHALREIFGPRLRAQTLLTWLGYALMTASFYFATSWTTKIIAKISHDDGLGITTNLLFNLGGAVGSALFGVIALKVKVRKLLVATMLATAVLYAAFGFALSNVYLAMGIGILAGLTVVAGVSGLYSLGPSLYSTDIRGTGFGLIMGVGRTASLIAPVLVGYILDAGVRPERIFQGFAIPLVISALAFHLLGGARRRQGLSDEPTIAATDVSAH